MAAILAVGFAATVRAQEADDQQDQDAPGRGVARISLLRGDVSVRRADTSDWVAAAVNAPVLVEDSVLTGPGSRAEVQFDWANMVRISSDAEVRMGVVENGRYQVEVARGTVTFRVLRDSRADVEISTPSIAVRPSGRGIYRVTVFDDGTSEVTVRSGDAEIVSTSGAERLHAGRTMLARGGYSDPEFQIIAAIPGDEWDRWNQDRDRELERAAASSYRYVDKQVYGAEDLDGNGEWINVPPYGWVWSPNTAGSWAPYQNGRWTWVDWYGWTWVSYDPWGWAPYHYGRWFASGNRWCWWPGGIGVRTWWRPALVGFMGWGGGGVGIGFGRVGWFPLAPYEPFHPWYGHGLYRGYGRGSYNNITVFSNTNITNIYRNARLDHAVTVVNGSDFGRGRVGTAIRVNSADIQRASFVQGALPVTPQRDSLRLADRAPAVVGRGAEAGHFYSTRPSARVDRVSFEQQQRSIDQISRAASGERSGWRRIGEPSPGRPVEAQRGVRDSGAGGASGWSRFGQPDSGRGVRVQEPGSRSTGNAFNNDPQRNNASGWTSFGQPGARSGDSGRAVPTPAADRTRYESPRREAAPRYDSAPRYERSAPAPRMEAPRGGGSNAPAQRPSGGGSAPRSAPSGGGGGGRSGGGSGGSRPSSGGGHSR
jgi:hypothetical protein